MLDAIRDAIAANQLDTRAYSDAVKTWMAVMGIALLSSVFFAPVRSGARWILSAAVLNIAGLVLIRVAFPELDRTTIGTSIHLIYWTLVLVIILRPSARAGRQKMQPTLFQKIYGVWLVGVSAIMVTSLVLDLRTALGWLQ